MRNFGIETHLPDKLVPIHLRHQDISDNKVRSLFSYNLQRLRAAFRFDQPVTSMDEYGDQNAPIVGALIHDKDSLHWSHFAAASMQPTDAGSTCFDRRQSTGFDDFTLKKIEAYYAGAIAALHVRMPTAGSWYFRSVNVLSRRGL